MFSPEGPTPAEARRLLELGLATDAEEAAFLPGTRFGDYELGALLGQGGMGVVYRACHVGIHRHVALKLIRSGDLATDGEVLRFRAEAAANLDHPNIVPVYHFGEWEGHPFFTMRLFERGTLADELARNRPSQRRALELVRDIALAVQHAHERGVLHRDLKPTNILLDEAGDPHVADFGIARRLDEPVSDGASQLRSGHPDYMAPEQVLGNSEGPTVGGDVYALGVIFYELLTGERPARDAAYELPVRPPSSVAPRVLLHVDLVCSKCLERDPKRRYESARQLADDIERCLSGAFPLAKPRNAFARLWWQLRRYPFLSTAIAGAFFVSGASATIAVGVIDRQEHALREEVLKVNGYAAQATAGQVLFKLREIADQLARCAVEPALALRIRAGVQPGPEPESVNDSLRGCGAAATFDSVRLFDQQGVALARVPAGNAPAAQSYAFRDYFLGARRLAQLERAGVHVGMAIHSESDDQFKLPLAAPIFDDGRWVGVIMGTVGTDSTLASLELPNDDRRLAVLVGLRDRERSEGELPDQYLVLVHRMLEHGQGVSIDGPELQHLARAARELRDRGAEQFELTQPERVRVGDPHRDPLLPGRWLAGLAPVGNTGYAVIVQTAEGAASGAIYELVGQLLAASGGLFLLGMASVLSTAHVINLRRQRALE